MVGHDLEWEDSKYILMHIAVLTDIEVPQHLNALSHRCTRNIDVRKIQKQRRRRAFRVHTSLRT
jgi:hypothetical protein